MANFNQTLEQYINSSDFEDGIVWATKASWGSGGYSVELFEDGTWRNLWNNQIGNKYETTGLILGLPTLSEEDTADINEEEVAEHDEVLRELVQLNKDDLARELRDHLSDQLATMEM